MATQKLKPTTIEEYINAAPAAVQERLWLLHQCILKAAPAATENLKWRMPAYSYQKILVSFAVFKHHIGFYPMSTALEAFKKELDQYQKGESSIQFPLDKPLPLPLITRIVKFRVAESKEGTIKWRS